MSITEVGKECRFAVYVPPPDPDLPDLHLIKENISFSDGTTKPNVRVIANFQRQFFVTNKGAQNHKSKKEYEDRDKVIEFKTSQSKLGQNIAKALGMPGFKGDIRKLGESPFLYGSDILSTAIIKKTYQDKYPEINTKYSLAIYDVESDVINGTEEIIMATFSFKEVVYTVVQRSFLNGISNAESRVEAAMEKYLGEYVLARNIKSEMIIVDTEIEVVRLTMAKAHECKPDFLGFWNIDFDITKIINACEKAKVNPASIFSDPVIPQDYQYFKYKQGPKKKVTASGLVTPIKPAAQWHTVFTPASFYCIDAMCVYKQVRVGKPEEQSYSLDNILNKELGIRKLKFKEADHVERLKWHQLMQTSYKIEYIIYNRFDCISIEILDEKTNDLSVTMPLFAGCSDFTSFNSQPRRACDTLHFYYQTKGKVFGSTGSDMAEECDEDTMSLKGIIVALPASLVADNGLCILEEYPNHHTNIRAHQADLDVSAAYPTNQCVFNISKETTKKEITKINGVDKYTSKMQNFGLSAGPTNALEYSQTMFKFPNLDELLTAFNNSQ